MITRNFQVMSKLGVDHASYDASCEGGSAVTGVIIDRLMLGSGINAAMPSVAGDGDIGTSTAACSFVSVEAKIQHSSTTCADDFADYSTGSQAGTRAGFIVTNTTSTAAGIGSGYLSTSTGLLSTSTGAFSIESNPASYDMTAAKRYLRMVLTPHLGATSSGGSKLRVQGQMIFGAADQLPYATTSTERVIITT